MDYVWYAIEKVYSIRAHTTHLATKKLDSINLKVPGMAYMYLSYLIV